MVIVTGCPRSGTKYLANQWQGKGYDVQHERLGTHGIVSWCLAADTTMYPAWHGYVEQGQLHGEWTHLVRDPLKTIASLTTIASTAYQWAYAHAPEIELGAEFMLAKAASFWVTWNALAERRCTVRTRLEDVTTPGEWRVNARGHMDVTWADLEHDAGVGGVLRFDPRLSSD